MGMHRRVTDPGGADWRDAVKPGDVVKVSGTRGREYVKVVQVDSRRERTARIQAVWSEHSSYSGVWLMRSALKEKGTAEKLAAQTRDRIKAAERKGKHKR